MFTTLQSLNKSFDPFSIGFDRVIDEMLEVSKTVSKYPPYNIKKINDKKWVIEMAVAGFAKTDIEISLAGNKLTVEGSTQEEDKNELQDYLFKGIANRNFTRTFNLADKIEIKDAEIVNGMLKVWLESLVETQEAIKKITVK